jgi:hypothetical protein
MVKNDAAFVDFSVRLLLFAAFVSDACAMVWSLL